MSNNSQIGDNEYTTVEQRRKQNLSRMPVVQNTGAGSGGSGTAVAATATAASSPFDEYKSLLRQIQEERRAAAEAAYNAGKKNLDNARKAANKDAYIAYMHGLKNMPQISAMNGTGGYAQSLINKQQLNYENNRADIRNNYMDNLRQLQANRDAAVVSGNQDYLTQLASVMKDNIGTTAAAPKVAATNVGTATNTYKLGGNTYDEQGFIAYLKGLGMTQAEIAAYMQARGLSL